MYRVSGASVVSLRRGIAPLLNHQRMVAPFSTSSTSMQQQQQKQATEPIQQLFVKKVREYAQKQKAAGGDGTLVDSTPEVQKNLKDEMARVANTFGIKNHEDASKIPPHTFKDPELDPINVSDAK